MSGMSASEVAKLPAVSRNLMTSRERRSLLLRDIDVVIDGGANSGQYGKWIRECGFDGRLISVEPGSEAFALLSEAASADDQWHCRQEALGLDDGTALLNLTSSTLGSSTLARTSLHSRVWPDDVEAGVERVVVRSLRSLWQELDLDGRRVFLKLDVEGAELSVLQGAGRHLDDIALLEVEVPLIEMYEGAPTLTDILVYLAAQNFTPIALEQNHRGDESTGQMLMLDGVFRSTAGLRIRTSGFTPESGGSML